MTQVNRSALVPYSDEQMFALVEDIDAYPQFLPWCESSRVIEREADRVTASLGINHGPLRHTFTTRNVHVKPERIEMALVEGPFQSLSGCWQFKSLGADGCKISLDLNFTFAGNLVGMLAGPVFQKIANNMVDAFCQRARQLYGG